MLFTNMAFWPADGLVDVGDGPKGRFHYGSPLILDGGSLPKGLSESLTLAHDADTLSWHVRGSDGDGELYAILNSRIPCTKPGGLGRIQYLTTNGGKLLIAGRGVIGRDVMNLSYAFGVFLAKEGDVFRVVWYGYKNSNAKHEFYIVERGKVHEIAQPKVQEFYKELGKAAPFTIINYGGCPCIDCSEWTEICPVQPVDQP